MIHLMRIVDYDEQGEGIMAFRYAERLSREFQVPWVYGFGDVGMSDPWPEDITPPVLLLDRGGFIPDFIKLQGLTFASTRALEILQDYHVSLQIFDCAVQLDKKRPPVMDSHKLYRLLDQEQVVDLDKSTLGYDKKIPNRPVHFRDPVATASFLTSDKVMARDTTFQLQVFVKDVLKAQIEQAGLWGCEFTPFEQVTYGQKPADWEKLYQERYPNALPRRSPEAIAADRLNSQQKASKTIESKSQAQNDDHASSKSISATELTEHDQHEIEDSQRIALKELNLTSAADPKTIVQAIAQVVDNLVEASLSDEDATNCAVGYGCLYGEQICRHHDWQWRMVHYPDQSDPALAVVTSDYAYVVHPMALVYDILANDKTNNLMLLFNLLGTEDKLPADRQQGGFVVLG